MSNLFVILVFVTDIEIFTMLVFMTGIEISALYIEIVFFLLVMKL